jgi:hypothetical protein
MNEQEHNAYHKSNDIEIDNAVSKLLSKINAAIKTDSKDLDILYHMLIHTLSSKLEFSIQIYVLVNKNKIKKKRNLLLLRVYVECDLLYITYLEQSLQYLYLECC